MKLLSVTSFFLVIVFIVLYNSCETNKVQLPKKSKKVFDLENKAYQKELEKKYDSAVFYAQKMLYHAKDENSTPSIKDAYNRLSLDHRLNKTYDSAIYYSEKLYEFAEETNDTLNMAKAIYKRGWTYRAIDSFSLAYKDFIDSKNLYLKIKDSLQAASKLLDISNLEKKKGNFGLSQLYCIEGLKYVENTSHKRVTSKLYYNIAVSAKEQGDLLIAEKRINQALALIVDSLAIRNPVLVGTYNNTRANILKEKGDYEKAIKIYEFLLNDSSNKLTETKKARINSNLAHTLFLKYGYTKRSDSLLKKALPVFKKGNHISELISINMKLAEIYSERNQQLALSYLKEVVGLAERLDNRKSLYEAYQQLIKINGSEENITRYLVLEEIVAKEKDSIESRFVNTKFDFEKSENKRIKAENNTIIAENKASKIRNQLLVISLVLLLVLVATAIIYQRIKRRHKIEKLKTVHVTEARISSKVHDELANDLYELMTQLETASPEKEVILDKLDTIYNQARDISKQIQTVETGKAFADELSNLFRSYQSEKVNVLLKRYDIEIWKGISSHIKVTVYRVLQELLTNMKKHSNAALVVVSIEKQNKQLFIQYIDNGKGFTKEISKNGLHNAENRIRAIKGKLTFDTELQKGCKFSINVPV
ncbi:tetratricopeptide repeat-containing sensor histidine kinase [uncultured Kordia sp.]|uniref:tetratricopeptide repeat-containing sensor histidine kinase n=1 Tax=uncultured Kordia sp. TaxID=507699 RepID=UPI002626F637|nr:tetratricopeptide repeat-containing sensor histidine kinase [uncultured Kordia sp.]